jgi:hypothetical protein
MSFLIGSTLYLFPDAFLNNFQYGILNYQEVAYAAKGVDIKAKEDKKCGGNRLTVNDGKEDETDHCTGRDMGPKTAMVGPLKASYVDKGEKSSGKGFKMSLKPSFAGKLLLLELTLSRTNGLTKYLVLLSLLFCASADPSFSSNFSQRVYRNAKCDT